MPALGCPERLASATGHLPEVALLTGGWLLPSPRVSKASGAVSLCLVEPETPGEYGLSVFSWSLHGGYF